MSDISVVGEEYLNRTTAVLSNAKESEEISDREQSLRAQVESFGPELASFQRIAVDAEILACHYLQD